MIVPPNSTTNMRPSERNLMATGRSNPVAKISFVKKLVFDTFTVTGADTLMFAQLSRARAVKTCVPFATVRVSHERP